MYWFLRGKTVTQLRKSHNAQKKQGVQMEEQQGENFYVCIAMDQNKNELPDAKKNNDDNQIDNAFVR